MNSFMLHLQSLSAYDRVEGISSFIGEDASGYFGIRAKHERFLTLHVFGLARYRNAQAQWEYIALPGGVVYFVDNALYINTRRFLRDTDYERIGQRLEAELVQEEEGLRELKRSLWRMEERLLRRLWELGELRESP